MKDILIFQFVPQLIVPVMWCDVRERERGQEKVRDIFWPSYVCWENLAAFCSALESLITWLPHYVFTASEQRVISAIQLNLCSHFEKSLSKKYIKQVQRMQKKAWNIHIKDITSLDHFTSSYSCTSESELREKQNWLQHNQSSCEGHLHWWEALFVVQKPRILLLFEAWERGVPSNAPPLFPMASKYSNATSIFLSCSCEIPLVFFAALIQYRTHMAAQKKLY